MTASPPRRNKIRLIAIATTGVAPHGAAPACFPGLPTRMGCQCREGEYRKAGATLKLQPGRMIKELPGKFELCLQQPTECLHSEHFGRVVSGVK